MFRTFLLKGTKDGIELTVKENSDFSLLSSEIEQCFSLPEQNLMPITFIRILGDSLTPLEVSLLEHLIEKVSGGRIKSPIKEAFYPREFSAPFSVIKTVRSGEYESVNTALLVQGSVHSGALVSASGMIVILENLFGTAVVPDKERIYIGKKCHGQIRIGENIYFPKWTQKNGVWLYAQDGKLCLEDNGGNRIYG